MQPTQVLALGLALGSAAAPARADEARRIGFAKELVAQIHLVDAIEGTLPLMAAQMRTALSPQGRVWDDTDDLVRLCGERVGADSDRYGDAMAEAYAQMIDDDLSGMSGFDATPLGLKLIANRARLLQASAVGARALVVRPKQMIHPFGPVGPPASERCTDSHQTDGEPSVWFGALARGAAEEAIAEPDRRKARDAAPGKL